MSRGTRKSPSTEALDLAEAYAVKELLQAELFQKRKRVTSLAVFIKILKLHKRWHDACGSFRKSGGASSKNSHSSINNKACLTDNPRTFALKQKSVKVIMMN